MPTPRISIATLGGTLSMQHQQGGEGITPALAGDALLATVPAISDIAQIGVQSLSLVPSASLDFKLLLQVLAWANRQIEEGADGVVVTQGTDTLEETAAFLDYLWTHDAPLVVTGAMRPAGQAGADGPGNILDATLVACTADSRARGVLVVMNAEVHEARHVRKSSTLALHAFTSPVVGPVGLMIEGRACYLRPARARMLVPLPTRTHQKIALLEATLAADTLLLEQLLPLGYEGLVIAGFGAGHVSASWSNVLARIATKIPVLVGTRTGSGPTAQCTYGFEGGEIGLIRNGLRMCGLLCPRKARLLLWLLAGSGRQDDLVDHLREYTLPTPGRPS